MGSPGPDRATHENIRDILLFWLIFAISEVHFKGCINFAKSQLATSENGLLNYCQRKLIGDIGRVLK